MLHSIDETETQLQRMDRLYSVLVQVNQATVLSPTREALFHKVCWILVEYGDLLMAWIGWGNEQTGLLEPVARWGDDSDYLHKVLIAIDDRPEGRGPSGTAYRTARHFVSNDLLNDPSTLPWRNEARARGYLASAVFPLKCGQRVCGTLNVYAREAGFFQEREVGLLLNVAQDLSFALDYFARLEVQGKVQAHLERYSAIVESTGDAVVVCTLDGVVTEWNAAAERMFGYAAKEMIGQPIAGLIPAEHRQEKMELFARVAEGEAVSARETVRIRKDGTLLPVAVALAPVMGPDPAQPGNSRVTGVSAIYRDISRRKLAEEQARREYTFSEAMIESMPGILYFYNDAGEMLRWNRNFSVVSGYSNEEMRSLHPTDFFRGEDRERVAARIQEVFEQGEATVEADFIAKDGTATPYFFTGRRLLFDGSPCLVGVGIDISRRKAIEADLEAHAALLQATYRRLMEVQENERRGLARELHDTIGQELTALSLNLTLIGQSLPAPLQESLGHRLDDSQKLLEDTMQHLRHIMVELRPPGIDELGLFAALREHARRVAQRSGCELVAKGQEPVPRLPPATAIALFRIAQEALNNSVKHARATVLEIHCRHEDGKFELQVADNGHGFAPGARRALTGLHGMGMTTMRERAEAIGATLDIRSDAAYGTRIIVTLPHSGPAGTRKEN
ncbi:MAG: PAS domain S-box protein [Betaproteobacteria bacterium]|nr:PAS domain S-box protein [Betaproteobacteria bacterium]